MQQRLSCFVMSSPVSAWLSLASSPAICGLCRHRHTCRPTRAWIESVPVRIGSYACFRHFSHVPHSSFAWSRRVIRSFQLKILQYRHTRNCGQERMMTIEKAREARRNFHVGERMEHGTFSIASAEERRRGIVEPSFCREANAVFESNRNRKARSARFHGGDDHRFHASGCDQRKTTRPSNLLSTSFALEGDRHWSQAQDQMVRARSQGS